MDLSRSPARAPDFHAWVVAVLSVACSTASPGLATRNDGGAVADGGGRAPDGADGTVPDGGGDTPDSGAEQADGWADGAEGPTPAPPSGPILQPAGEADIQVEVDTTRDRRPISAFIYGLNSPEELERTRPTLLRSGGNRLTAYNWENNASNAGSDWCFQNDAFLVRDAAFPDRPGEVVRTAIDGASAVGAATMVTIPVVDYVAADKDRMGGSPPDCESDIRKSPDYVTTRLRRNHARSPDGPAIDPVVSDDTVYQDAFVRWTSQTFPHQRIMFSMDNEPDLWAHTHPEVHPDPVTYAELRDRNIEFAAMVKDLSPRSLTAGLVSFGWLGWTNLLEAPDAQGVFVDYYLDAMRAAEVEHGVRLIDVLDLHYYPEARDVYDPDDGSVGTRVTEASTEAAVAAARVQAPRSLWDPGYVEQSWIAHWMLGDGPMELIPGMLARILAHYPGTKLGFSEWNFGGGAHISGALASADVLGIFGRYGVYAAAQFGFGEGERFTRAAFQLYRNFDGRGATFGDTSVFASTSDVAATSVYASIGHDDPRRVAVVLLNKDTRDHTARLVVQESAPHARAAVWRIESASPDVVSVGLVTREDGAFTYTMPGSSASLLFLFD